MIIMLLGFVHALSPERERERDWWEKAFMGQWHQAKAKSINWSKAIMPSLATN